MSKVLLIDSNTRFASDVQTRLILSDADVDLFSLNDLNQIPATISQVNPDMIVLTEEALSSQPDWDYGIETIAYARTAEELKSIANTGTKTFGIIKSAKDLAASIESGETIQYESAKAPKKPQKPTPEASQDKTDSPDFLPETEEVFAKKEPEPEEESDDIVAKSNTQQPVKKTEDSLDDLPEFELPNFDEVEEEEEIPDEDDFEEEELDENSYSSGSSLRKKFNDRRERAATEDVDDEIERDLGKTREPAKVVTVYSAKGGVGKTTLSTEIATYLALTSHGRGTFKVCIVDYNIDFGDVLTSLDFASDNITMTSWAADIKDRQESKENLKYTPREIESFLQCDPETGLYGLLAPITNEDSMEISEKELEIMLDNLINNSDFDYIVCDTGNNTRDSSFIALEKADAILLVLTQDVNAANDNQGILNTLDSIGFDMNKVFLVINQIESIKATGIDVEEVEECLKNPYTDQPYYCIGRVRRDPDIKIAKNEGRPLVLDPAHDFTHEVGKMISLLTGENHVLTPEKKKGFFSKLFKK